ncbi:hypothetical protein FIBSPDRAFT_1043945 [Athelia psychrophila]|uniref:Uncharacterized protein n=1 Tax=Athelia psychrophila TaxID=1759441 RepID=A0A166KFV3_9AGAM|nr:hypothetical protein FIBSPDRAFT_1043945 [Fibularhizoctonia sp. CBS 109695]
MLLVLDKPVVHRPHLLPVDVRCVDRLFMCALRRNENFPLQRWPRILQFLHILLDSTITTFRASSLFASCSKAFTDKTVMLHSDHRNVHLLGAVVIQIHTFSGWSIIGQHAMNSHFALFEILLTNIHPAPWVHVVFLEVFLACYLGVAYITKATEGFYAYDFLDQHANHALLAAYIPGIGFGGASSLRVRVFRGRG